MDDCCDGGLEVHNLTYIILAEHFLQTAVRTNLPDVKHELKSILADVSPYFNWITYFVHTYINKQIINFPPS